MLLKKGERVEENNLFKAIAAGVRDETRTLVLGSA